jgi:hypothetical protein
MQRFYTLLAQLWGATEKSVLVAVFLHHPFAWHMSCARLHQEISQAPRGQPSSNLNIDAQNMLGQWEDLHL